MNLWLAQLALPVHALLPLGLSALAPLLLIAVVAPVSRWRGRGMATALTLRTVVVLALGFAALATVASVAIVHTGIRELRQRHTLDVKSLVDQVERGPLGMSAGDALFRLTLFRQKDPEIAFVAAGTDGCRSVCLLSVAEKQFDQRALKQKLIGAWTTKQTDRFTISIGKRPYVLVAHPVRDVTGKPNSGIIVGIDATYLADQAEWAAWILIGISYSLLVLVGWTTWKQVSRSLATRIRAMHTQLRQGVVDESTHENLEVAGHELRELADSVSSYIKRSIEERASSEERHRRLAEMSPDAVLMCVDRRIRSANPAAIALAGAKNRSDLVASPIDKFLEFDEKEPAETTNALRPATWRRLDGKALHVEVAEVLDKSGDEIIRQFVVRDVTSRREREAELTHRAEHDALTGLVNRARFEGRLRQLLDPAASGSRLGDRQEVAVVFIDLDGFKPINDTYGHAAGDAVLVAVAARLRDSTRGSDLIARFGGDEFAVLLEVRDRSELGPVAQRMLRALQQTIIYNGRAMKVGASLGLATARAGGAVDAAELVKAADEAMYTAKSTGGDRFIVAGEGKQSTGIQADIKFPAVA
jgi:diguanylate cyclase (GGDEF)-like protein/PAS domain S-box-containing protein